MRLVREAIALAAVAFEVALVWQSWNRLPAQVPLHYGVSGRPDSYGAPSSILALPAISIVLYVLLTVLSFVPQSFNYPVAVTVKNQERLQALGVSLLGWLKAELTCTFAYIAWITVRSGGEGWGLGWAFLPTVLAVVGATIVIGVVQMRRAA